MKYKILKTQDISILLTCLPYLFFNFHRYSASQFYSNKKLFFLFSIIFLFDILFRQFLNNISKNKKQACSFLIFVTLFFLIYGFYITNYLQPLINQYFGILIRGRVISIAILIITILVFKTKYFKILNTFLIILSLLLLLQVVWGFKGKEKVNIDLKRNYIIKKKKIEKPVILIISDEYSSPNEIYKIKNDSSCYELSKLLQKNNWNVVNSFISTELSTSNSISEIFNFNASKNQERKSISSYDEEESKKLLNPPLLDSIYSKGLSFINFSIFDIGENKSFTKYNFFATSFLDEVLNNTAFKLIQIGTHSFKFSALNLNYYPSETHNKYIINSLSDSLNRIAQNNYMAYVHIYMPHSPFQFLPEFEYKKTNTENYIKFWHYTSFKIQELMLKLSRENKYRIILTGDHGYRGDNRINPHNTFIAFYGFNNEEIKKINSVQDLGSLINSAF